MLRNVKLTISYDGSDFAGWQTQPQRRTVQETLEAAITQITQEPRIRLNASGRTDAGVHAIGQVANFFTTTKLPPETLVRAINANVPHDVSILAAEDKPEAFDANHDAVRKMYRYIIHDGAVPSPFLRKYCCQSKHRLDDRAMREAARVLVGQHDFHSFETEWPNRASSVRTITHLAVNRFGDYLWIDVEADGFLYNMVRAIAGTLINVGRGYWPIEQVAAILDAEDRTEAGPTAPAEGLFLMRVTYES
jgi:tRNA pseudouridine38-40 synthase